jgi:hypothetical protein
MTNQEEGRSDGTSRRDVLRTAGLAAAAIGGSQLIGQTAATAAPATAPAGATVSLSVVDFVDGHYVLEAQARQAGTGLTAPLRLRDGLKVELTSGRGEVLADPYTGEILVKPTSGDVISARAVISSNTEAARIAGVTSSSLLGSESTLIGSSGITLTPEESMVNAAGGGACVTVVNPGGVQALAAPMVDHLTAERQAAVSGMLGSGTTSSLRVRAAIMGNVIPYSPEHREINWRHARYYGTEDVLGLIRFTYQQGQRSAVTMNTLQKGGAFFPAKAVNEIYCRMEMLDLGSSATTRDAMRFPADSITWPVYSTPMTLEKPVTFYDEAAPDREVMTVIRNEMRLYDYNGVTIKRLAMKVGDRGTLRLKFEVTNQTDQPFTGRWMLIGDHTDATFASTDDELTLGPARSAKATKIIEIKAPIRRRLLSQRVGFAVMSLSNPVVLGISPVTFKFPSV